MKAWPDKQADGTTRGFVAVVYAEKSGWLAAGAADRMARLLAESTASDDAIESACAVSGWSKDRVRRAMVAARQPTADSQRKGKFGEAPHAAILEEFHGMQIVVKKHRYNPAPNASPHGVDIIALHGPRSGGDGESVVYAETKLRTAADSGVLRDSYESLVKACSGDVPPHLAAELNRLREPDPELFNRLVMASFDRPPLPRIGLVAVKSSQRGGSQLDPPAKSAGAGKAGGRLSVDIVRIEQLEGLIDESYAGAERAA